MKISKIMELGIIPVNLLQINKLPLIKKMKEKRLIQMKKINKLNLNYKEENTFSDDENQLENIYENT